MRLSIRRKLFVGFLAVIFVNSLIVLVSIGRLSQITSTSVNLVEEEILEVHLLWNMKSLLFEMEADLELLVVNPGQQKQLLQVREKATRIRQSMETYERLPLSDELAPLLKELMKLYRSFHDETNAIISFVEQEEIARARALLPGTWKELQRATLESLGRLLIYENRQAQQTATLVQAQSHSGQIMIISLAVVGVLLSLALALGVTDSVTRPIRKLVEATERIAKGDLSSRAQVIREDEIGLLAGRFNEMIHHVNRSFEDQRRFYADVSHELRTPITIIRGNAEVALRAPEKSQEEYREALRTTVEVANQMGRMVDDLLFLARSDVGQIRYHMVTFPLATFLEEIARQSGSLAALKNVHLRCDARSPIEICGDPQRLRQLFLVLIDNAVKCTKPGGEVKLTLDSEPDWAKVLVSDTGIGIPEKDLPHIFERFYQGDFARSRPEGGTGLGLAIAQSIVKAHQGEIFVESELGRGTSFSVLLPHCSGEG